MTRNVISSAAVRQLAAQASGVIPPDFVVGIVSKESSFDANCETPEPNGTVSIGLCQVNASEQAEQGIDGDLHDPWVNIQVFAGTMEDKLAEIRTAGDQARAKGLPYVEADVWYYLAWAHNAGTSQATTSILKYGLDWTALKARPQNAYVSEKLIPYAAAAVAGINFAGVGAGLGTIALLAIAGYLLWEQLA